MLPKLDPLTLDRVYSVEGAVAYVNENARQQVDGRSLRELTAAGRLPGRLWKGDFIYRREVLDFVLIDHEGQVTFSPDR